MIQAGDIMAGLAFTLSVLAAASWFRLLCSTGLRQHAGRASVQVENHMEAAARLLVLAAISSALAAFLTVMDRFMP